MQSLYNCKRIDATHFRITKFDNGLVPFEHHDGTISSYACNEEGCDCPQGHKPSCRHRKMLPFFIEEEHVGDNYFFIWDTHQWFKASGIFADAIKENEIMEPHITPDPFVHLTEQEANEVLKGKSQKEVEELIYGFNEGGSKPVSAAPSPQPSRYRRMR